MGGSSLQLGEELPQPAACVEAVLPTNVWVVVPAYNEAARIGKTLELVLGVASNVIVVDDGSTDGTAECAEGFGGVWVLRHGVNCGAGAARQTGFDFALQQGAEIVVTFDADGQHSAAEIPGMVAPIASGEYDIVLGSRTLGAAIDIPLSRKLVLLAGTWFTQLVAGISVTDTHNGFRVFSRRALQRIRLRENRMAYASELLHKIKRSGLRYCERPVTITYNAEVLAKGQSSWAAPGIAVRYLLGNFIR